MTKRKTKKRLSTAQAALKALLLDLDGGLVWKKSYRKLYEFMGGIK